MDTMIYRLLIYINSTKPEETFHKLAITLLKNIDKVIGLNLEELSDLCFVSQSTFSRFCKELKFQSFSHFKFSLDYSYGFEIDYDPTLFKDLDLLEQDIRYFSSQTIASIGNIEQNLNINDVKDLCRIIHDQSHIHILGHTNYQFLVMYLQMRLALFKKIIYPHLDFGEQQSFCQTASKKDTVILVSPKGNQTSSLGKELVKNGVVPILITQNKQLIDSQDYQKVIQIYGSSQNNLGMISFMHFIDILVLSYYSMYKQELLLP